MRYILLLVSLVLLGGCSDTPPESHYVKPPSHALISDDSYNNWQNIHWARTTQQFVIPVINNSDWNHPIYDMLEAWNALDIVNFSLMDIPYDEKDDCQIKPGMLVICNDEFGVDIGWAGLAAVRFDALGHIMSAVIKLNDSLVASERGKSIIVCQELGHILGIAHSVDSTTSISCMDVLPTKNTPSINDSITLEYIYYHTDENTSINFQDNTLNGAGIVIKNKGMEVSFITTLEN